METGKPLLKEASRIPRKPERPYLSSLKSYPMNTRRRPLQTYSKRTPSTESTTEPAPKRRCIASPSVSIIQHEDTPLAPSEPEQNTTSLRSSPPNNQPPAKRGTITAYFQKIAPQPPVRTSSSELSSEPTEPTITPPSSPPTITPMKRRTRRLNTRIATRHMDEIGSNDEDDRHDEKGELTEIRGANGVEPLTNVHYTTPSRTGSSTSDRPDNISGAGSERDKRRGKRRREKRTASVQTTLGLSTTEPQYTECKECDMLYNHLHETDVKYHARRHAALQRAKARASAGRDVAE
ncbi:hypothetical protein F4861DRAFT_412990 [Xylaria intraflava]|nr:hypothetical protein F4861DRAFT_412990 [Xylaria intraflava]